MRSCVDFFKNRAARQDMLHAQLGFTRFALIIAILLTTALRAMPASAQSACRGENCSEWVVEKAPPSTSQQTTSPPSSATSPALPECKKHHELECGEECRREFDAAYHICTERCLTTKCTIAKPTSRENRGEALCVEYESAGCDDECRRDRNPARCRRDCLGRKCPDSGRYERAMEGLDPGSAACRRCEARHLSRCERRCRFSTLRIPASSLPELREIGCERLCMSQACGTDCGMKLPF